MTTIRTDHHRPLATAHLASITEPDAFWLRAAEDIDWERRPTRALDARDGAPHGRWFPGGRLNTCYNAVDRHVRAGRGQDAALIYHSAMTGERASFSYLRLRDEVARVAGALRRLGVRRGDRVVIYMPMVPEAVFAMLACARIGAVHAVVFGGFAPPELAARIDDARPRVVVTASCGLEPSRVVEYHPLLEQALDRAEHQPRHCLVLQRSQATAELRAPRDIDWDAVVPHADPVECVPVEATDPLYILYTSGTTGRPKGVVRDNGGHAVALRWSMSNIFDIRTGEVFWAASDVGWVVGHSYIVYGPLLAGAATVLYEGKPVGTPDAGTFWRVAREHGVAALFTAPTALRAIRQADPEASQLVDLPRLRTIFMAGERLDPDTCRWISERVGKPVVDNWWQTETGWPIAANPIGLDRHPPKEGSVTKP
uniref:AMP-binding protein n=1 Tax=Nocardia aurea TaxID=2144174 RepID=UPI000D6928BE